MSNYTFDTVYGRGITYGLQQLAVNFDLSYFYGTAPLTYTMNQYVMSHTRSIVLIISPVGTHTRLVKTY